MSSEPRFPRIGFLGLGAMGAAIVERLLGAGYEVVGWNRSQAKAQPLVERGMEWAATPREAAARGEILICILTDAKAIGQVLRGPDGALAGLGPGKVLVEMSTISPHSSLEFAKAVQETGGVMLDAPLSGSIATLQQGGASVMVGGDEEAYRQVEPVLRAIGPKVMRIGGNGQALYVKLAINLTLVVQVISFCEAVALAEKAGVQREAAVEAVLKSVVASPVLGYRGPFILDGKMPAEAWADVNLQQKDMLIGLEVGRGLGVGLPLAGLANEMLNAARAMGFEDKDFAVVYEVYRKLAGLTR